MRIALFYEIVETTFFRYRDLIGRSFGSMRLVSCGGHDVDRFVLYDPVVTKASVSSNGWTPVPVGAPRKLFNGISPVIRFMNRRSNPVAADYDVVVSIPSYWLCEEPIDVSRFVLRASDERVLMVAMGGSPREEVDGYSMYSFDDGAVPGYRKLRGGYYNIGDVASFHCPAVVNVKALNEQTDLGNQYRLMTSYTNSGWKNTLMTLYPSWIHTEYGDGKPKIFSDLVGIRPQHWDRRK